MTTGESLVSCLLILAMTTLRTLVFWTFWAWFVVPLGAPPLGLLHAYAAVLFVGFVMFRGYKTPNVPVRELLFNGVGSLVAMGGTWGLGAVVHFFGGV